MPLWPDWRFDGQLSHVFHGPDRRAVQTALQEENELRAAYVSSDLLSRSTRQWTKLAYLHETVRPDAAVRDASMRAGLPSRQLSTLSRCFFRRAYLPLRRPSLLSSNPMWPETARVRRNLPKRAHVLTPCSPQLSLRRELSAVHCFDGKAMQLRQGSPPKYSLPFERRLMRTTLRQSARLRPHLSENLPRRRMHHGTESSLPAEVPGNTANLWTHLREKVPYRNSLRAV